MIRISKKLIEYISAGLNTRVSHFILIHEGTKQNTLLSHANLFLYQHTRSSLKTSSRYASVISMFYRYLSTLEQFTNRSPSTYHLFATNKNISDWQTSRETNRVKHGSERPSSETIFEEAKLLLNFFRWLGDNEFTTGVNIQLKTWIPPYKSPRFQEYVSLKAKNVIDSTSISVLDKVNRQSKVRGLISPIEIQELLENYSDAVYPALFFFALGTAMRPMDLCKFPYFGNGENRHIMPFSSMTFDSPTVEYTIFNSKRKKTRTIIIHKDELKKLEDNYITPHYQERANKYFENYGERPPLSMLFLTKDGHPVQPDNIASRTTAAKKKAIEKNPSLRQNLCFYDSRDWWPTQYMIRSFGDKILTSNNDIYNHAIAQILLSQMGHKDIRTTFKYYLDLARVILSLHKGQKNEIFKPSNFSATSFLASIQPD